MKNNIRPISPDTFFWHVSRVAFFALSVFSVYVLKFTVDAAADPSLAFFSDFAVPEMIKTVLAGCAAVFFFGFIFELEVRKGGSDRP